VPKSLEYQVAHINTVKHNLIIPNITKNNFHRFLNEVADKLKVDKKELIEEPVQLLQNEDWVIEIKELIKNFECN